MGNTPTGVESRPVTTNSSSYYVFRCVILRLAINVLRCSVRKSGEVVVQYVYVRAWTGTIADADISYIHMVHAEKHRI